MRSSSFWLWAVGLPGGLLVVVVVVVVVIVGVVQATAVGGYGRDRGGAATLGFVDPKLDAWLEACDRTYSDSDGCACLALMAATSVCTPGPTYVAWRVRTPSLDLTLHIKSG